MVSIDDFMIKGNKKRSEFTNYYLDKIKKGDKRNLRILEGANSENIKKFTFIHSYLSGIGSTPCTNTSENVKSGKICPFCQHVVDEMNKIALEHFNWLKTLDIVNKDETEKFNNEILKLSKDSKPKLIFSDGKVFELEDTFNNEIYNKLNEDQKKIYVSFSDKYSFAEGKARSCKFYLPVFDYATDEVKIWEISPSIWNKLDETFIKAGYDFTSADFSVTHNGMRGNWWLVSKKDSSPISDKVIEKYNSIKSAIIEEINRKVEIPTTEKQNENYKKYCDAVEKKKNEKNDNSISNNTQKANNNSDVNKELEELFS